MLRTTDSSWFALACVLLLSVATLVMGGCSRDLKVTPEPYRGPMVSSEVSGDVHRLVVTLPSPGWSVEIDATRQTADATALFISLRRPNPAAIYPQQTVTQRVQTRVATAEPIRLLARVIDYGIESDTPYRRVR